ncbi:MAG: hypothetical protein RR550_01085 [Rikenellaceae bacterium]
MRAQIIIIDGGVMTSKPLRNRPIIVIITGDGVIEKPITLCDRIIKSPDFLWSRDGDTITFTRTQELKIENLMFIKVSKTTDNKVITNCQETYKKEYQTLKNEKLLKIVRKRLTYPLLGAVLLLLLCNTLLNNNISKKNNKAQQELTIKRRNSEKQRQHTAQEQRQRAKINPDRETKISITVDKIAASLPDHTLLTQLTIDPLIRSPENKKELQINRNTVVIKGLSKNVSELQHALSQFLTDVKIKKIEQDIFEIEAHL